MLQHLQNPAFNLSLLGSCGSTRGLPKTAGQCELAPPQKPIAQECDVDSALLSPEDPFEVSILYTTYT